MTIQTGAALVPLALPALLLTIACLSASRFRWHFASWLSFAGLLTATASATLVLLGDGQPPWQAGGLVSVTPVSHLMAVLISFLSLIIGNFSRNYVAGEIREVRYAAMLHLTLAAVAITVLTDNLLLLIGGWVTISLGLHQMLLFYPERQRAALAAHKKFLLARLAELALLAAALLLHHEHGTWQISEILAAYQGGSLGDAEQIAALLLALAALIKCAQLPVHGWLIQVVEAPTPVSALLHAGIINLGGYLIILFAPLIGAAEPAQWLLLVVAGLTATLAGLIMTTRVSIKVKLAWSTSAQMGLMLVECALGLYELALLHLLAHACYKAYSFLNAGSAVQQQNQRRLAPRQTPRLGAWISAFAFAAPVTVLTAHYLTPGGPLSPWLLVAAFFTVLLAERDSVIRKGPPAISLAFALVLMVAFVTQKVALGSVVASAAAQATWAQDLWVALLISALVLIWTQLSRAPRSQLSRRLSAWLFAGLYLDEWFTRTTMRVWPRRLPIRMHPKRLGGLNERAF